VDPPNPGLVWGGIEGGQPEPDIGADPQAGAGVIPGAGVMAGLVAPGNEGGSAVLVPGADAAPAAMGE
jgi:hypothetical protein